MSVRVRSLTLAQSPTDRGQTLTLAPPRFGSRLKAERDSRGLSLTQVSATTKIPVALLEALEREDLSRWPKGLYRRAFFRSYVTALGLPPDPLAEEFARAYPEDAAVDALATAAAGSRLGVPAEPLALTLAEPTAAGAYLRAIALALFEVGLVAAAGSGLARISGLTPLAGIAVVALVYYPVARAMTGRWRRLTWLTRLRGAFSRQRRPLPVSTSRGVAADAVPFPTQAPLHAAAVNAGAFRGEPVRPAMSDRYRQTAQEWSPRARQLTAATGRVLRRGGRTLSRGALTTGRVSARVVNRTSLTVRRGSAVAGRVFAEAARRTSHVSSRGFRSASYAFWGGVRKMAEHAQLLAARQLNRSRE